MADLTLTAQRRTVLGKKVARLRRAGITPANVYGHNVQSTAIQIDSHDLDRLVRRAGHTSLISLTLDGDRQARNVLVRDISRRPTTGQLLHVDFIEVSMREKLTVDVPLTLHGKAPVLDTTDATLVQNLDTISVQCLPAEIPAAIEVDLSSLVDTTSTIRVRDLTVPETVTVMLDPDSSVVSVVLRFPTEEEVEAEAAAAAEAEAAPAAAREETETEAEAEQE
jgi:large subunit ribosomal protein L25